MMREVLCYTIGDSTKVSTWSGIPYFFTKSLEAKDIKVQRVDLSPPSWMLFLYNIIICRLYKFIFRESFISIYITVIYRCWAKYLIRKYSRLYPDAKLAIFFTYLFSYSISKRPCVLLGDWTLQYYIDKRLNRPPTLFEKINIFKENKNISKSELTISLFPQCVEYMTKHCLSGDIRYLGTNVVNNYMDEPDPQIVLQKKTNRNVLFIGREHYREGFRLLECAFNKLSKEIPGCRLDVVGLESGDSDVNQEHVYYHGYLRKECDIECRKYYKLLSEATVIVNVNPNWAGYSSIIEAMYYYTPIIVSPFNCFIEEFGRNLQCGSYCSDSDDLYSLLKDIMLNPNYETMCYHSHKLVENYTWENYIKQFIKLIESKIDYN